MTRISFLATTVFASNPIKDIFNFVPADTLSLNTPSISVIVPVVVPSATTFAPIIGSPFSSTTIPLMALCCCTLSMAAEAG